MIPFTVGALGCAALLGLGNGAVFKLVPQFFPANTATVTGLVGAMGGLGGFFPPLCSDSSGIASARVWPGFALLAFTSAIMWVLNQPHLPPAAEGGRTAPANAASHRARAAARRRVGNHDHRPAGRGDRRRLAQPSRTSIPPLVIYTFAVIFATWGIVYHYAVWLQQAAHAPFFERSRRVARTRRPAAQLGYPWQTFATHIVGQTFIRQALADALVDASVPVLGLRHGRR